MLAALIAGTREVRSSIAPGRERVTQHLRHGDAALCATRDVAHCANSRGKLRTPRIATRANRSRRRSRARRVQLRASARPSRLDRARAVGCRSRRPHPSLSSSTAACAPGSTCSSLLLSVPTLSSSAGPSSGRWQSTRPAQCASASTRCERISPTCSPQESSPSALPTGLAVPL